MACAKTTGSPPRCSSAHCGDDGPASSSTSLRRMVSGNCDLYIGSWTGTASRFVIQGAGSVGFRLYQRSGGAIAEDSPGGRYIVSLDGHLPESDRVAADKKGWESLHDSQWLYWLDHPEECPAGTVISGPDVPFDPEYWQSVDDSQAAAWSQPLHASFLRQHPYEFLPTLVGKIQKRIPSP